MSGTATMTETRFREVMYQLRSNVPDTKAIVLIGPDGLMLDHLAIDPAFDLEGSRPNMPCF